MAQREKAMQKIPGYCTLCRSRCGTLNTVENGRLTKVEPLVGHPTGQAICNKGRAAPEIAHGTNRLLYPMRRTMPKGSSDPGWQRISWDEALSEIAKRLIDLRATYGAETVVFGLSSPSGTAITDSYDWMERLAWLYGSPNVCNGTEICNWPKDFGHRFTFGHGMPPPDYGNSDTILLWGFNPATSWLAHASAITSALARGAKLIVVDPRRAGLATRATLWLPVKPGTDGILALGLIRLILDSNTFNDSFVRHWTTAGFLVRNDTGEYLRWGDIDGSADTSFVAWSGAASQPVRIDTMQALSDDIAKHLALSGTFAISLNGRDVACRPAFDHLASACQPYSVEHTAAVTGIPETSIREAASLITRSSALSYHCWTGISQHANAAQTERAIALLYALTGCFDAVGGNVVLNRQPVNRINPYNLLSEEQRRKTIGLRERPLGPPANGWVTASDVYTAMLEERPYKVRALIAFGSNILSSMAEPAKGRDALGQLEFHVQCDLYETPTSRYADILLPINSAWEREGLRTGFENNARAEELIQLRPQMVPAQGESRSDAWVVFELARRLGLQQQFFEGNLESGWNHILAPLGITVDDLRRSPNGIVKPISQSPRKFLQQNPAGITGFPTPSRRIEIYSDQLRRIDQDPVPRFSTHVRDNQWPLWLSTARNVNYCHSQHRGIVTLRKRAATPSAEISTQLAAKHDLVDDDWIAIETPLARAQFKVKVNADMSDDTVIAEYGWWQSCDDLGLKGYELYGATSSNYNGLIRDDVFDPISGAPAMRSTPCRLKPLYAIEGEQARVPRNRIPLRVAEITREADNIFSLILKDENGKQLPPFHPGQHITLRLLGSAMAQAFSISSSVQYLDFYRITAKSSQTPRRPDGSRSQSYALVRSKVGDVLLAQSPAGLFRLPLQSKHPVVLIAGGIGITPFMSYLETLAQARPKFPVRLLYGNKSKSSRAFAERIAEIERSIPSLVVTNFYSQLNGDRRSGPSFEAAGHISALDIDPSLIEARARFYLCGPDSMIDDVSRGLLARGVPPFEIHREYFQQRRIPVLNLGGKHLVRLQRSGRDLEWTPRAGTILELAEMNGVVLPSGCRVGECENCSIRVLKGETRCLSPTEFDETDHCLSCQSVPVSDVVLDA